jgi:hypothetical protein
MIGGPMDGPHALALNERLLELLADAGLPPTDAARASYLLIVHVFGSIALEVADVQHVGPLPRELDRIAARQLALSATPVEHFPRSAAAAATMAGYISTEQYLWGLRRLLDGLAAWAETAAAGGADPAEKPGRADSCHDQRHGRGELHRQGAQVRAAPAHRGHAGG